MPRARRLLLFALTLLPAAATAQVAVLDEGTLSHFVDGTRSGREDFSIRASRAGAPGGAFIAQANVLAGERRRSIVVNADSSGQPLRFQLETRDATVVVGTVVGERQRNLWLGRIQTAQREAGREFRLADHTCIVEPGVAHHLWFALRVGEGRPFVLFRPSETALDTVVLAGGAADSVTIGARAVAARRWELRGAADASLHWEIWADAQGRILRARHPATAFEALRDDPPGETLLR